MSQDLRNGVLGMCPGGMTRTRGASGCAVLKTVCKPPRLTKSLGVGRPEFALRLVHPGSHNANPMQTLGLHTLWEAGCAPCLNEKQDTLLE